MHHLQLSHLGCALAACTALFFASLVLAEDSAELQPQEFQTETTGLDPERLARISEHFSKHVKQGEMVGALGMIWRHGELAFLETWGERNRAKNLPITEDTLFRIYSMSKPITSVGVMMLYEEGHFRLGDPVSKFLPELANLEVASQAIDPETGEPTTTYAPAKHSITIRDLLRHTSGMTYGIFSDTEVDRLYRERGILGEAKISETVAHLGELPLLYEPGTQWHYGVSTDVLGRLIEVISGQSFGEFLRKRLFKPLQMNQTSLTVSEADQERFAHLYAHIPAKDGPPRFADAPKAWNRTYHHDATFQSGGGGFVSTAADYLRFCRMLLNEGALDGARILSRKTVELMRVDHMASVAGKYPYPGHGFGLGFTMVTDLGAAGELSSIGAYRWAGAAGTGFWIDPKEQMIGIFMTQVLPAKESVHRKEFRLLAYQAIID
jgi:CubicO group peptidase (beta-lactamase class C family)